MKRAKSKFQPESNDAARAAALEKILRLTGKDPLIAFAEAACGALECTGCNGAGIIKRDAAQMEFFDGPSKEICARCQGTKREKVSATAMLNARYKLATFFYAPLKAVEMSVPESGPEGAPQPQHGIIVRFAGRHGDEETDRG